MGAVGGMFKNPNDLALNMVAVMPLAASLALRSANLLRRAAAALCAVLMVGAIVASQSRSGTIGLLVMALILGVQLVRRTPTIAFAGVLALLLALPLVPGLVLAPPLEHHRREPGRHRLPQCEADPAARILRRVPGASTDRRRRGSVQELRSRAPRTTMAGEPRCRAAGRGGAGHRGACDAVLPDRPGGDVRIPGAASAPACQPASIHAAAALQPRSRQPWSRPKRPSGSNGTRRRWSPRSRDGSSAPCSRRSPTTGLFTICWRWQQLLARFSSIGSPLDVPRGGRQAAVSLQEVRA